MNDRCSYVRLYSSRSYNIALIIECVCIYMITHTGQLVGYYMYDIQDQHFPWCVYYYFPDSASNWYMVCIRTVVIFQYIDKN